MTRIWNKHKQTNTPLKRKVFVALSGGVDSSVTAALLLKKGYDVTGAFMKQTSASSVESWSDSTDMTGVCSWKQDRRDALRVAASLGIPLLTLDFEKEYKHWVTEYMFREYEAGRTPNPDVLCNTHIKFGVWLSKAQELGFAYLATGHYARIDKKARKQESKKASYGLLQAKDKNKDQTYFLHQLNQNQLAGTLFPIGNYLKSEVRSLARRWHLPTAERPESMGICFVGEVPMKEFLQKKIRRSPGKIVTTTGEVVGEHEGLAFYTMGQRHLNVQSSAPLYVVAKRRDTNELVVGHENDQLLYTKEIRVAEVCWVSGQRPLFPLHCKVRLRHRHELQKAEVCPRPTDSGGSEVVIIFQKPQRAVTPGQFAVFYNGATCLGGGVIL